MTRIAAHAQHLLLACAFMTMSVAGCASDGTPRGGIEAALTLDPDALVTPFAEIGVLSVCSGVDPLTGLPRPNEVFLVNVSTSEGTNPLEPKPTIGIFKREGLPEGSCTMYVGGVSDDETTTCVGFMAGIPVVAGPDNTFVTIVLSCISDARHGGIAGEGKFNQCMEVGHIVVSPTTQSVGDDINIDLWCYDPDGDDGQYFVLFVTEASYNANPGNLAAWQHCGPEPYLSPAFCPHADPPLTSANQSASTSVTCNVSNEDCLVIVGTSDDFFAHIFSDPTGCNGFDANAQAVVPTYCIGLANCGDGSVELPEECDPPGAPNGSSVFCNESCKVFDPCANPLDPPASCPAPADPECQSTTCSESGGAITCGIQNATDGVACSLGICQGGVCSACFDDAGCDDSNSCTTDVCNDPGLPTANCSYTSLPVGSVCDTTGQCNSSSACQIGACTNAADSGYVCSPAGAGIKGTLTACTLCELLGVGCPNDCSGDPIAPSTLSAACMLNTIYLGGDGGACTSGLSIDCLGCYYTVSQCGLSCAASCAGSGPTGANGCTCLDCVYNACDTEFAACAGFSQGLPNGTLSGTGGIIGGPPACEAIPTPACDE
jgi:hypothetical protein